MGCRSDGTGDECDEEGSGSKSRCEVVEEEGLRARQSGPREPEILSVSYDSVTEVGINKRADGGSVLS